MVKYCVSSKYSGPTCYDINPGEYKSLKVLSTALVVSVLIVITILIINHFRDTIINDNLVFKASLMTIFVVFAVFIVYQAYVTSGKQILCRGYYDCNKI